MKVAMLGRGGDLGCWMVEAPRVEWRSNHSCGFNAVEA